MKTNLMRRRCFAMFLAGMLAACSGGDINIAGPEISPWTPEVWDEAITAHGEITDLNDLTVNGFRYETSSATVRIDGQPGLLSDLDIGQVVTVNGDVEAFGRTGAATMIRLEFRLVGPVENLDADNGRMLVMGQTVLVAADAQFGPDIDPATWSGLAPGSIAKISGYMDADRAIRAKWIGTDAAATEHHLTGVVSGLDAANLLFTMGRLTIDYRNATMVELPGGAPANGMVLKAIGQASGGLLAVDRLVSAPQVTGSSGERSQLAGVVTRFRSRSDFDVNHRPAAAPAGTTFTNGDPNDLMLNAEVVVDGEIGTNDRITAERVSFGDIVTGTTTLEFDFRDFTVIAVPTVFNVNVTQGTDWSVEVVIDTDDADRVSVTQLGNTLSIALASRDGFIETLTAHVTMPRLDRIDLSGVVNATLSGFEQLQMTVNVGGVSRLAGFDLSIDDLTARISGVSQLAFERTRPIGHANIDLSGVSQATLNMGVGAMLSGSVSTGQGTGTSTLFYYGTDVNENVTTGPISSVTWLGPTRN